MAREVIFILLKIPYTQNLQELQRELERALWDCMQRQPYLEIVSDYEKVRLPVERILLMERRSRKIWIEMCGGEAYGCYGSLRKLSGHLPPELFFQISENAVINLCYMKELKPYEVTLVGKGKAIRREVSRRRYAKLRQEAERVELMQS